MNSFDLPSHHYAYDEIAQWPDEARRELDAGTPIVIYAPGFCPVLAHSRCVGALLRALENDKTKGNETVLLVDWQMDNWNSVAPDLCFFSSAPAIRENGQCLIAAPDLIIEVLDECTRDNDTRRKPALYARQNVALFWLVDPQNQTVTVHQNPTPNGYENIVRLTRNGVLTHHSLTHFHLPLDQIFD